MEIPLIVNVVKSSFDIALKLRDLNKNIELKTIIFDLLDRITETKIQADSLINENKGLTDQIRDLQNWNENKHSYKLQDMGFRNVAYIHIDVLDSAPNHLFFCANCFENKKKSVLHFVETGWADRLALNCPVCKAQIHVSRTDSQK